MVEQPVEVDTFLRHSLLSVVEQVIEVPKLALPVCAVQRAALSEPQLVEQLVEVPTVLSYSLLQQQTAEQIIDFPVPGRGGLVDVFKVFPKDRVPQRLAVSRPSFLLVEVFKGFPKDRVPQRLPVSRPSFLLVEVFMGFPKDRVPQRLSVSRPSLLVVFKVFPEVRVPQRLPVSRPSFLLVEMRSRCCSGRRRSVGHSSGSMLAGLGHCTSPSRHTALRSSGAAGPFLL